MYRLNRPAQRSTRWVSHGSRGYRRPPSDQVFHPCPSRPRAHFSLVAAALGCRRAGRQNGPQCPSEERRTAAPTSRSRYQRSNRQTAHRPAQVWTRFLAPLPHHSPAEKHTSADLFRSTSLPVRSHRFGASGPLPPGALMLPSFLVKAILNYHMICQQTARICRLMRRVTVDYTWAHTILKLRPQISADIRNMARAHLLRLTPRRLLPHLDQVPRA